MEIFKLFGTILVDSSEAEKSISKTGDEAEGLGSKLKSGIATAAKWATAITGAAVAVGGAMVKAAKDTSSELDVIDKASIRMGLAAESYQELAYAAGLSGVEMTVMETAAKNLQKTGSELSFDEALAQVLAIGDESERTAKAVELFGNKAAYEMAPLLQAGTDGMAEMRAEANELGLVLSQDTVSSGAALNDMFSKVEESIGTLKNGLVADLMPYVMDILQWLIDNIPRIKEIVKSVTDYIIPIVKPILEGLVSLIKGFISLVNGDIDGFGEGVKTFLKNLATSVYKLGKDIATALWDGIKNIWTGIASWVSEKLDWLKEKIMFWKKSSTEMETDGSHASGLNYVPYDGYTATLHRGESVVSAGNTQAMIRDIVNGLSSVGTNNGPIELTLNIDGKAFARATYSDYQNEAKRVGKAMVTA